MITEKNESHIDKVPSAGETERTRNIKVYIPNVDILEQKNAIVLIADMPGINENSVHVTLERNVLTIKGDVETDHYKGYTLTHAEYGIGDYERAFTLDDSIDQGKIEATVSNGVLRLVLPKAEPDKPRKIEIKGS